MSPQILLALVGVFVAVALSAGGATWWWLARTAPEQVRLRNVGRPQESVGIIAQTAALVQGPDPQFVTLSNWIPKSPKEMSKVHRRMIRAGFPDYSAVIIYAIAELGLPIVLFFGVIAVLGPGTGWIPALLGAGAGYVIPSFYVGHRTTLRQKAIRNGLPDALDLLTVCVEAGSALDQALSKASHELEISHPELAEELRLITTEVRAGKPRLEAFRNFAQRTGVEDVRTLVSMLTQTDRFGTSIGDALRVHSENSRTKRRQEAEERANKVGVKLVFPLALCLFPALYIVCFGPVVVKVYRAFFEGQ
jgi:tight adherence protein C